jgi:hypothetical protein
MLTLFCHSKGNPCYDRGTPPVSIIGDGRSHSTVLRASTRMSPDGRPNRSFSRNARSQAPSPPTGENYPRRRLHGARGLDLGLKMYEGAMTGCWCYLRHSQLPVVLRLGSLLRASSATAKCGPTRIRRSKLAGHRCHGGPTRCSTWTKGSEHSLSPCVSRSWGLPRPKRSARPLPIHGGVRPSQTAEALMTYGSI